MTREEAIELLEDLDGAIEDNQGRNYDEAFRMAIKALSTEAVPGVGRYENAMQKLREMPRYLNGIKAKQIKGVSSEAVQGEWTYLSGSKGSYMTISCPICGSTFDGVAEWKYHYCPNCGAKMIGGEDE